MSLPAGKKEVTLALPDGTKVTARADSAGVVRFGATDKVGIYQVEDGIKGRDTFAVNLEDDWESNIAPRQNLRIGIQEVKRGEEITSSTPEIWRWFVGAALLIAFIEWYIYNRRVLI